MDLRRVMHDFAIDSEEPRLSLLRSIADSYELNTRKVKMKYEKLIALGQAYPTIGRKKNGKSGPGFGDKAMTAMFVGLVCAYIGSYVGTFTSTGNFMPLIVLAASALAMAVFTYFTEKKKQVWLDNFSMAGSMLISMAAAVVVGLIV